MIDIKGRRIMLVGGCGFIGHNLALELKKLGAEVCVVDGLAINNHLAFSSDAEHVVNRELYLAILIERQRLLRDAGIPVYVQDARDYHAMSRLVSEHKPQVLVQLAAVSHANKSNKDPHSTFDHSFRTLENSLDACRKTVDHFIFFSSSMVYGHFNGGSVTEDTICEPLGIYGALKFGSEKLVIAYNQAFDMDYTIIRPSALYGRRCVSRRVGQIFIENAMRGTEITIQGDGSDCLDFTYIDDLVDGIVRVIEHPDSRNQVFNMTYGAACSLKEMADIIAEHFPDTDIKYVAKDKLMPDRGTLCMDKAEKLLGFKPSWPLERGFPKYIEWYKSLPNELFEASRESVTYG
jgi:nucleoside-diphosphate-sugar epimerase